ncbi:sugar phosphate isomerase/epimerase family protein [Pseudomonas oryzihabitans]|uniref:sugar phosphate isomerase/epimerase family protein n=1 Tax=Pseudomonas oryzihabitans TaxID=47885 RepID=UPI00285D2273|nr:TIM barrel protein [Pseudomonas psychrotolerans]MDR6677380.1 sugar phosphate isomerase/epimerase [Pseudomonas psychrotolerans]
MKLDLFRSLWGHADQRALACSQARASGFAGIEARLPQTAAERRELGALLAGEGLDYIAILFTGGTVLPDQALTPAEHLRDLERQLDLSVELAPRFVNVLAGNDRWSSHQQLDFFGQAQEIARRGGHLCSFETHRARCLATPWVTLEVARQLPELLFTTDISHWVVGCERLLDDPADDLDDFISRVHHIQARVGYDQGPQVPHPAAPEYARELAFHQSFWAAVWRAQQERGYPVTTLTPEFGPDGYTFRLPFTGMPIADLWELNRWMADTQRDQFQRFLQDR